MLPRSINRSFSEWNEHAKVHAAVVYGSGQAFCSSGDALVLAQAESGATGAEYFGDLDPKGIAIPMQFMEATGICLEPALRFYQAALRSGLTNKGVNRMTDTQCRTAKPKTRPYKLRRELGLFLLVNPNGSKWWRFA